MTCYVVKVRAASPGVWEPGAHRAPALALVPRTCALPVKKDICISCGNCSTYCEMGIDVRQCAMANQDVRRAACVGCGMCAQVCPRGY